MRYLMIAILMIGMVNALTFETVDELKELSKSPRFELLNFLYVVNYQKTFPQGELVYETATDRCYDDSSAVDQVSVNFKASVPPSSSLESIDFVVAKGSETQFLGKSCKFTFELKPNDVLNPLVKSYSRSDLIPCNPVASVDTYVRTRDCNYVTCTGFVDTLCDGSFRCVCPNGRDEEFNNYGKICKVQDLYTYNEFCPTYYFSSNDWQPRTYTGRTVLDEEFDVIVCRYDVNPLTDIPYQCYSDVCGGRSLNTQNQKACVSSSDASITYTKAFVNGETGGDDSGETGNDATKQNIFKYIYDKVVAWIKELFTN